MNLVTVWGTLAVLTIMGCHSAPVDKTNCSNIESSMSSCLREMGLESNLTLLQSSLATEQGLRDQCDNQAKYREAAACVEIVVNQCSLKDHMPFDFHRLIQVSFQYCNDPLVNFRCLSTLMQSKYQLQLCISSRLNVQDIWLKPIKEYMCLSMHAAADCSRSMLLDCDVHTANLVSNNTKSLLPTNCLTS